VRLAEAPSHGLPVLQYDIRCRGAEAYLAAAREMLRRAA
jgi:chromosome partitioning protein